MDNRTNIDYVLSTHDSVSTGTSRNFLSNVFAWMFLALLISAISSLVFAFNPSLISMLMNMQTGSMSPLGMVIIFSPLAFVLIMSFGYNKLSFSALLILFLVYSAITGISLSFIFLAYTSSSIALTFGISALTFGAMALTGYRTTTDLSKFGSIMRMLLFGLIIAMVANFFMHSSSLEYLISFVGVAVFTGLTAYDVQRLKIMAEDGLTAGDSGRKLAVMGALKLYLDFINMFLFLLRLFGRRK